MRYNIFNKAHRPLKAALITACIGISKNLLENVSSHEQTLRQIEEALQIFHEQVTYETLHVLPLIFDYEPSIWNNYTNEHNRATALADRLIVLLQSFHNEKRSVDKTKLMSLIGESFNEFVLFNFNHMDDEEAVLNEILWRYYQDKILVQTEEKIDILPHLLGQNEQKGDYQLGKAA